MTDEDFPFVVDEGGDGDFASVQTAIDAVSDLRDRETRVRVGGDRAVFENCRFVGRTLYAHGRESRQYYRDCSVEGDVDFVRVGDRPLRGLRGSVWARTVT